LYIVDFHFDETMMKGKPKNDVRETKSGEEKLLQRKMNEIAFVISSNEKK
jgi:hypothetical protein